MSLQEKTPQNPFENRLQNKQLHQSIAGLLLLGFLMGFLHRYGDVLDTDLGRIFFIYLTVYVCLKHIFQCFKPIIQNNLKMIPKTKEQEDYLYPPQPPQNTDLGSDLDHLQRIQSPQNTQKFPVLQWLGPLLGAVGISVMIIRMFIDGFVVSLWVFALALIPIALVFFSMFLLNWYRNKKGV